MSFSVVFFFFWDTNYISKVIWHCFTNLRYSVLFFKFFFSLYTVYIIFIGLSSSLLILSTNDKLIKELIISRNHLMWNFSFLVFLFSMAKTAITFAPPNKYFQWIFWNFSIFTHTLFNFIDSLTYFYSYFRILIYTFQPLGYL